MSGRIWFLFTLIVLMPAISMAQDLPKPNALIVWNAGPAQSVETVVSKIIAVGGRVDHVFSPSAAIGYVPSDRMDNLKAEVFGLRIEQGTVEPEQVARMQSESAVAATVWNAVFRKIAVPARSRRREGPRKHPPNDARIAPDRLSFGPPQKAAASPASSAPGFMETSEYFIGSVTVGIITPESNGAIDTNRENWSSTRQNTVVAKIAEGLQWWKDNANAPTNMTFVYDIHHSVPTSYEPIRRSSADEDLWISQVMNNLGYPGSSSTYFTQVRSYLNDKRNSLGTDWAIAIFVVDSLNDADGEFTNGDFAYTYLNGPFMVMTYDNDNWGIDEMQIVTAHEFGHVWGALDEYAASGCTDTETGGYLNIANTNCENGMPATETSIMRNPSNQVLAYATHQVSTPVRQMFGWRDSDGDGKERYDPVDTPVSVSLTPFSPDPTPNATPTYTGYAADLPFPSPLVEVADVTINIITGVEWRVDGGTWQAATASDGAFDSDVESFTFTASPLVAGAHTFQVRATNSVGNISSNASDTLTIVAPPGVTINDVSVAEGNSGTTNAVFTVTLSAASSQTVTVSYSTVNGTATAGSDYAAQSGIVTFNPGEVAKVITIMVNGDKIPEGDESFFVNLTSATNASIGDGQGVGTILNDDTALTIPPMADFNGDAISDVAGLNVSGNVFYTTNRTSWTNIPGALTQLAVGDFDGNGTSDIAGLNSVGNIFYTTDLVSWTNFPGVLAELAK